MDLGDLLGGAQGAIVAIDPRDGRVLGLAERASALGEAWPVGSIIKPVTAAAALEAGVVTPGEAFACPGGKSCWLHQGHGALTLERALAVSCNHTFAEISRRLGSRRVLAAARLFGLRVPDGYDPSAAPDYGVGLGPGIQATPLQVAELAAAIATGRRSTGRGGPLPSSAVLEPIRRGMRMAAAGDGTSAALRRAGIDAAGKTGTARHEGGFRTHGWFMGWAPAGDPRVVVAVFVHTGEGRKDAVPIAARVFRRLLPDRGKVTVELFSRGARELSVRRAGEAPVRLVPRADLAWSGSGSFEVSAPGSAPRRIDGALEISARSETLHVLARVALEDYVAGVVDAEMPFEEPEALMAQAVVSRTFAARERGRHGDHDFCDLTHCQLFRGAAARRAAVDAARATRGQALLWRGGLARAYFHAHSGGVTAEPPPAFGAAPYLAAVADGRWLAGAPHGAWEALVPASVLARALGVSAREVRVSARDASGRAERVLVRGPEGEREISGYEMYIAVGRAAGWHQLKSARFEVRPAPGGFLFTGSGLGHGVGMSQWGARGMARAGMDHAAILGHYFPGVVIGSLEEAG